MKRIIATIVLLAGAFHLSAEEPSVPSFKPIPFVLSPSMSNGSSEDGHAPPLAPDVLNALRNGPTITLLSLDPTGGGRLSGPDTFHGWKVLGQTDITAAEDRQALATSIETAVTSSKGMAARCFMPHHGLAITSAGQTYEFVVCFMCGRMHIHTSGQGTRYSRITGKGEVLDKLLSAAKIPVGKRSE